MKGIFHVSSNGANYRKIINWNQNFTKAFVYQVFLIITRHFKWLQYL